MFARVDVIADQLSLIFGTSTGGHALRLPTPAKAGRADELWRTTCFEFFVRQSGSEYLEFNFSPSGQWAAYAFGDYREAMRPLMVGDDPIFPSPPDPWTEDLGEFILFANLGRATPGAAIALTAVIEEQCGTKSYWALAHGPGPPDFHDPACFIATLPAPEQP